MAYNTGILLGRITKASGFEGAVAVKLEQFFSGKIPHMESVFLEVEGRPVPFFIADYDYSGADILKLRFQGYDSPEVITGFVGCRVFLTGPAEADNSRDDMNLLTGFTVLSSDNKVIGTISEIIPNPGQLLLDVISPAEKHILIPLHEDFIVSIDRKKSQMVMNLPEGLTDIN
jgi:16S rRNA processing protein RimM